jgi:protein-disulfide isomerase
MKFFQKLLMAGTLSVMFCTAPVRAEVSPEVVNQIKQALSEHPEILLDVLRDHSETVLDIVQQGADHRRTQALLRQWQEDSKDPKKVALEGRPSRGSDKAPITLVAFSDFACTYCQQASSSIENVIRKYPDQIRFVFKQIPVSDAGKLASQWFLAAMKQDDKQAWLFYANLFSRQQDYLADPMKVLREVATEAKLNVAKLEADLKANSKAFEEILAGDVADAKKLGFTGTPYFLVNNLVLRGALPLENFVDAVEFARKVVK